MELSELKVFLRVSAERSFSRAATKLHRTQPAVSQAVKRLEESVGERLFDRATKDATLTEAGRLLRDYAERLLRLSEEAETAVRGPARPAARPRAPRRQRGVGPRRAAVHRPLPPGPPAGARGRAPRAGAPDRRRGGARRPRLRRAHVSARRAAAVVHRARARRAGDARRPVASARRQPRGDAGRVRAPDRDRAQRPVAHARPRAAAVRAAPHPRQHPDFAAEPRGHQARGEHADGRGAAAAPVRRARDRARRARGAGHAGDPAAPAGPDGVPQGRRALARRHGVPRRGRGRQEEERPRGRDRRGERSNG